MAIYLGDSGFIEIRRRGLNTQLGSQLDPDDVNVAAKRFSFDFDPQALITGDQIEIATEDGSNLELVAGHAFPDGRWYIHVDPAGGIRLFDDFNDAINGDKARALDLVAPSRRIPIAARTQNRSYRCVGQVQSYSVTTRRDTVDITSLGEEFRTQYASGLISGQGNLSCIWDYEPAMCDGVEEDAERAHYFMQLLLRTEQGAAFEARLIMKRKGAQPVRGNLAGRDEAVWLEALCIVTGVAMDFSSPEIITSQIEFVTTGPAKIKVGSIPAYLLQQNSDYLLQESGDRLELEFAD